MKIKNANVSVSTESKSLCFVGMTSITITIEAPACSIEGDNYEVGDFIRQSFNMVDCDIFVKKAEALEKHEEGLGGAVTEESQAQPEP